DAGEGGARPSDEGGRSGGSARRQDPPGASGSREAFSAGCDAAELGGPEGALEADIGDQGGAAGEGEGEGGVEAGRRGQGTGDGVGGQPGHGCAEGAASDRPDDREMLADVGGEQGQ